MNQRAIDFIDFMRASDVLIFGDFVTKSGRDTPYFVNTGRYTTGRQMEALGSFYASTIVDAFGDDFDVLFGPAYKGIPLVVATAIALQRDFDREVALCFNRKEVKTHGEGGVLVGHEPEDGDRILIIEDVTTAGTSIRETVPILKAAADVSLAGLIVSVDRQERGQRGDKTALDEIGDEFGMRTTAIVTLDDIVERLRLIPHQPEGVRDFPTDELPDLDPRNLERLLAHRAAFGVPKVPSGDGGART